MGKDPAFLFYPGDWLGGTMGMTFEEKGAYMELLMLQFNRGHMTSHMIGQVVGQIWDTIQVKFKQDDKGLWYNARLDEEKLKRLNFTESRRNNKLGNNQYTKKGKKKVGHKTNHMTIHMENENRNENKDTNENEIIVYPTFFEFWDMYDKKIDRVKCEAKWKLLKNSDYKKIDEILPLYVKVNSEVKYRKNPLTFLNGRCWEDEIINQEEPKIVVNLKLPKKAEL